MQALTTGETEREKDLLHQQLSSLCDKKIPEVIYYLSKDLFFANISVITIHTIKGNWFTERDDVEKEIADSFIFHFESLKYFLSNEMKCRPFSSKWRSSDTGNGF